MAKQHNSSKQADRRRTRSLRRRRITGAGSAAGALFAVGLSPLTTTPPAHADVLDIISDPIVNAVQQSLTSTVDAITGVDPAAGLDLASTGLGTGAASALSASAETPTAAQSFDAVLATLEQQWINSTFGTEIDGSINSLWQEAGGSGILIGDGANGTGGGSLAEATGGAGGLLFGDGGNGATDAAGQGGAGGAAGLLGDGGNGGNGADSTIAGIAGGNGGAGGHGGTLIGDGGLGGSGGDGGLGGAGGAGGDGGNAVGYLGDGGNGGAGGAGSDPNSLAALGGAGGDGTSLGSHGAVGAFGTVNSVAPTNPGGTLLPIHVTGTTFTNSAGQVVEMHGFNYSMEYSGGGSDSSAIISDANAGFLAANGFNVVRLGVSWAAIEPEPGVFNTAYLDSVHQSVENLASHGIYTMIDMHQDAYSSVFGDDGAPAWAVATAGLPNPTLAFPLNSFFDPAELHAWDAFWSNGDASNGVGLEDNYAQMWEYVANYFNGNSNVLGFEIMNEPNPGSDWPQTVLGNPFFEAQQLTPFYDQIGSAIRAADPNTTVFFEPSYTATFGTPTELGNVDVSNSALSFHDYCEFFVANVCLPNVTGIVDSAQSYAQAHDIPAFMSEFGYSTNNTSIADTMQPADKNLMSWTEWAFSGQGSSSLVYNPALPPVGDNVNTTQLETLAEPYPQLISGTPESYSFANGTMHFTYSTAEADGLGNFPAGSQTTISVPSVEFPGGYTVSVTGGEVVSAANASQLIIESNPGTQTVTVSVSPTG